MANAVSCAVSAGLMLLWSSPASAARETDLCRRSLEAAFRGDVNATMDALEPTAAEKESLRPFMDRLVGNMAANPKLAKPRLERSLPDAAIETGPVGLQIWSFADKLVLIWGCHLRRTPEGRIDIFFSGSTTVEKVLNELRTAMPKHAPERR